MFILLFLHDAHCSEEVFDFSKNQITSARAKVLKDSLRADFDQIFQVSTPYAAFNLVAVVVLIVCDWSAAV